VMHMPFCPAKAIWAGFSGSFAPCPFSALAGRHDGDVLYLTRRAVNNPNLSMKSVREGRCRKKRWDTVGEPRRAVNFTLYPASLNSEESGKSYAELRPLSVEIGSPTVSGGFSRQRKRLCDKKKSSTVQNFSYAKFRVMQSRASSELTQSGCGAQITFHNPDYWNKVLNVSEAFPQLLESTSGL
jgi:hypothetical protein